jgi:hypothetical protein
MPDWHNRLVFRAIVPSHHLLWTIKLDDDDTAGEAPALDRFGLTTPDQKATAEPLEIAGPKHSARGGAGQKSSERIGRRCVRRKIFLVRAK